MARIPFAIQSYRHRDLPVSAQRCINWFVEAEPQDARSKLVLLPTAGLERFTLLPTGPIRGMKVMGAYIYAVSGVGVYRVDVRGASVLLGTIADGGAVTMADNGTQMAIVVPETTQAWYATDSALTQIADPDFGGAVAVTSLDGYGIFVTPDSTQFFISALKDMSSFDALDFASAEADPDNLVTALRVGRELWLFGERTTEIWANTGASDFPFQRISGAFIERGCAARNSVAQLGGIPFWLGDNRLVYQGAGASAPVRISTHAIEQDIAGYATVADARGQIYEQEGHTFYVLTFPSAQTTWVYDVTTSVWHERESEGYNFWRALNAVAYAGAVVAGDAVDGKLYIISPTACFEDGDQIIRVADGTEIVSSGKRMFHTQLTLDITTGVGLTSGQGSDPTIALSWSDDGGRTYGDERTAALGPLGVFATRVQFNRLGSSRQRVYRLQLSDPVRVAISAMDLDARPGAN